MPNWCLQEFTVNSSTISYANDSWRYCMSGEAPPFLKAKEKEPSLTPLVFFYNQVSREKQHRERRRGERTRAGTRGEKDAFHHRTLPSLSSSVFVVVCRFFFVSFFFIFFFCSVLLPFV